AHRYRIARTLRRRDRRHRDGGRPQYPWRSRRRRRRSKGHNPSLPDRIRRRKGHVRCLRRAGGIGPSFRYLRTVYRGRRQARHRPQTHMSNRFSLEGKTAFVTGGSRGIGRAIAIGLARAGADVAFTYRSQRMEAEKVTCEIEATGKRALALQMDVTQRADVEAAARDTKKAFGAISILVNNAGINKPTDFDQVTDRDWDDILSANLKGPFICAQ